MFSKDQYEVYRKNRCPVLTNCERGGGVLVSVRKSLHSDEVVIPPITLDVDQVAVKIKCILGNEIIVIVSYIPPRSSYLLYKAHIHNCTLILNNLEDHQHVILLGDFNLPNLIWSFDYEESRLFPFNVNLDYEREVVDTLAQLDLRQINHFANEFNHVLDLVFVDSELSISIGNSMIPLFPNSIFHVALSMEFEFYEYCRPSPCVTNLNFRYNFAKTNFMNLSNYLEGIDWIALFNNGNLNYSFNVFIKTVKVAIDMFTPKDKIASSAKPIWFNNRIVNLNNRKNKMYKLFRKRNDPELLLVYRRLQKEFDVLNKFLYKQYVLSVESNLKTNSKRFWSFINSKNQSNGIPSCMRHNNVSSSDLLTICNMFANHFQSVYSSGSSPPLNAIENFVPNNFLNVGILECSIQEVQIALSLLNLDKNPDFEGIPPILLQKCSHAFSVPLCLVFNLSLQTGQFLKVWKNSFLTPIFKSGSRHEICNYRPICKISTIPKLFEKIIYEKLTPLLKRYISPFQHGFVAGRSTTTNLSIFCNTVLNGLEKGLQCDVIYTDFAKAFDSVSHVLLISKLKRFGFHSNVLEWIRSYLTDRIQYVRINDVLSSPVYVTSGVPQGSHLGPLLFLLFINEIPDLFMNSHCLMFADDLKVFRTIQSDYDCILLQEDLERLYVWCQKNDLRLNVSKCQSLSFCRNLSPVSFTYAINNSPLSVIPSKKDLGVIFDKKLDFCKHIDFLVAKGNSMLGFILRNSKDFRDPHTLKCLFFAFVRTNLEYCSIVWNPCYEVHSIRIEKIQKRFTRVAFRKLRWNIEMPTYVTRCKLFGILPLFKRRQYFSVMFIRDLINNHIDCPLLLSLIGFYAPSRVLRNRLLFYVPYHRVNYGCNEPISRCLKECNKFSSLLEFDLNRDSFKNKLILALGLGGST